MRFRFAKLLVLLLFVSSPLAFAQWQWGRPRAPKAGACFYKEGDFGGDYFCLKVGERWPSMPAGFNDKISSIRVFGKARVRIFNAANFGAPNLLIDHNVGDLRRVPVSVSDSRFRNKNWNDRISSIAVFVRDRDEWRDRR